MVQIQRIMSDGFKNSHQSLINHNIQFVQFLKFSEFGPSSDLSLNRLTSIPEEIGKLTKLETLYELNIMVDQ